MARLVGAHDGLIRPKLLNLTISSRNRFNIFKNLQLATIQHRKDIGAPFGPLLTTGNQADNLDVNTGCYRTPSKDFRDRLLGSREEKNCMGILLNLDDSFWRLNEKWSQNEC